MYALSLLAVLFAVLALCASAAPLAGPNHQIRHIHNRAAIAHNSKRIEAEPSALRKRCKSKSSASSAIVVAAATTAAPTSTSASTKASSTPKQEAASKAASSSSTASKTKSASSSTSTGSSVASALRALFPVSQPKMSFTTANEAPDALKLSDATLKPFAAIKDLAHPYVQSPGPDSRLAMKATYPKGSVALGHGHDGGVSFYAPGPDAIDWTKAKEVTFGYSVLFEDGFDFNMGGKLFGLYGGVDADDARSCSGGRRDAKCFSVRLMFREDGQGELYTYLPDPTKYTANQNQCKQNPHSDCDNAYGSSIGRGTWSFTPGTWSAVSMRVRLNDEKQANGQIEVFADGKSVVKATGLVLSPDEDGRNLFRGMMFQTFFGGHETEWASPKDQSSYFSDFSVAVTEML
ncbi:hypothetical protein OF83DRAFT_1121141 [Amylostereum chailletii]|nr:hypothetical protein OF83DRAFT_1121141 [Amylostereum chailletii]